MKWLLRISGGLLVCLALGFGWIFAAGSGWLGEREVRGEPRGRAVPAPVLAARAGSQRAAAAAVGVADVPEKQILFGDLHVHTTFSFDAFLLGLPMVGGTGSHPPADACDFARYCSALDFWSINDHAEYLTERLWDETIAAVRQCNAIAEAGGSAGDPDLVTYLGWEWSQAGTTPENHYGHKNVVLLGTAEDEIPTRPIAATTPGFTLEGGPFPPGATTALALMNGKRGRDLARFVADAVDTPVCPSGVPVRALPSDCREYAATPEELFAKLDDWNLESLVIPHGTTWGIYTPGAASWDEQLPGHDPARQRLIEIYSGHGNAEEYRSWEPVSVDAEGGLHCPAPRDDYLPSCHRAGELIRERCLAEGESEPECDARADEARKNYVAAHNGGHLTAAGHPPDAWLDSGQCRDCFQPAFNHRPKGSAQYLMAIRNFDDPAAPKRFELGFIGSSDIHTAKPGSGYKEFWRGEMTEGRGTDPEMSPPEFLLPDHGEPVSRSVPLDLSTADIRGMSFFENERVNSFFVTGGLVAVHAAGRDRRAIWEALERKEVYATSGPRILLWFDLLAGDGSRRAMGSKLRLREDPRFEVRAVGSFVQKPGCPEDSVAALGEDRLAALCRGECYHPSDERRRIERIEVVRIRPQAFAGESVAALVEDPWRSFDCPADGAGCRVEFEDPDFAAAGRDAVYYARAIEEPILAIHGSNPLGCEYDEAGRCIRVEPCGIRVPKSEECLSETRQRAWSSPIIVDFDSRRSGGRAS